MRGLICAAVLALAASSQAQVLVNETFNAAGPIPASLQGIFDAGTDILVVNRTDIAPAIPTDPPSGDTTVLRIADLGTSGGAFNWVVPATKTDVADQRVTATVYVDMSNPAGFTYERDIMLGARIPVSETFAGANRPGYYLLIARNASWSSNVPANATVTIMKRNAALTYSFLGAAAAPLADGWYTLELEVIGTTINAKVNGTTVATGTDSEFASGYSAIGWYQDANQPDASNPHSMAVDSFTWEQILSTSASDWSVYH